MVKLVSTALTGFFYTARRPRLSEKLAFRKYDPVGEYAGCCMLVTMSSITSALTCVLTRLLLVKKHVLFTESKMK